MHTDDPSACRHRHDFHTASDAGERGTRRVLWITLATMAGEIVAGSVFNSMALLADGLHMSSHALAIGLAAFAYAAARRLADDPRFAFGTWKIEVLAGFTSAIALLGVVAAMAWGSVERLLEPRPIRYAEAMVVAAIGLAVNLLCARILGAAHGHGHGHGGHGHDHDHRHHGHDHADLNLRAAYVHVLADAATSLAAIAALAGGWAFGWNWLDPAIALVGAAVVAVWAKGLIVQTATVLLDREMDHPVVDEIREAVAERGADGDTRISDLHVWRVGRARYACTLSLVTHDATLTPAQVRGWLAVHEEIVHATIEIERSPGG